MDFTGKAKRLDDIDLPKLGAQLGVGEDELHAFIDVETRGSGFDEKRRPIILFERHIFHRYLPANKRSRAANLGLASPQPGGYGKPSDQYPKLLRAMAIDQKAALYACSWGLAQIMGFNHELAGYATVEDMIEAFKADEENHLAAAVRFIKKAKLDDELRRHDWVSFARGYNGPKFRINRYDEKLAEAYRKWSRIKDTPWAADAPLTPDAPSVQPGPPHAPAATPEAVLLPSTTKDVPVVVIAEGQTAEVTKIKPPATKHTGIYAIVALAAAAAAAWWQQLSNWVGGLF